MDGTVAVFVTGVENADGFVLLFVDSKADENVDFIVSTAAGLANGLEIVGVAGGLEATGLETGLVAAVISDLDFAGTVWATGPGDDNLIGVINALLADDDNATMGFLGSAEFGVDTSICGRLCKFLVRTGDGDF